MGKTPQRVPASLYHRYVVVGLAATVAIMIMVPLAATLMAPGIVDWPVLWVALGGAAATAVVVAMLPWRQLVQRPSGQVVLYIWTLIDIAAIGAVIAGTEGGRSDMWFMFVLTTVFFATGYPLRVQVVLMGATLASYGGAVAAAGGPLTASRLILQLAALTGTFALASFPSSELRRETGEHLRARRDANALAEELAAREAWWRALLERASDPVVVLDANWSIRFASPAFETNLGRGPARVTGTRLTQLVHPDDVDRLDAALADARTRGSSLPTAVRFLYRDGAWRHAELVLTDLGDDPAVGGVVANLHDVTGRVEAEQELTHQAFHDALTGLPNRILFTEQVEQALLRSARSGQTTSLIFVDLDNFKEVNDSLGHGAGDLLLREVAARFSAASRREDTLARVGGDEFAVVVEDEDPHVADLVAARLLAALDAPVSLLGHRVLVRASAGVATANQPDEADELVRRADVAMYAAKAAGHHHWERYWPEMHEERGDRLELIADLQQAVPNRELSVEYQPVIDVAAGRMVGVEALVRWQHPRRGRLAPAAFIGMAEEMGLIVDIGIWVLEEAAGRVRSWQLAYPEAASMRLAVNVSPRQIREDDFPDRVLKALQASGLPASSLTLEITETALLSDAPAVARRLAKLRAAGIRISIDDFGTGFSSLSHLQVMPVDQIKVDRSFIAALDGGGAGSHLVAGIVQLADQLELEVVAEGVETAQQLHVLKGLGCCLAQGFFFSQALAPLDLEHWLFDSLALHQPARARADLGAS